MSKTTRKTTRKSIGFDKLTSALVHSVTWTKGTGSSACSCSTVPFVAGEATSNRCPKGMPWECTRQLDLFPASVGACSPETESPPTCNTGVTRPESAQGEQKANGFSGTRKAGPK